MKKLICMAVVLLCSLSASAQKFVEVKGKVASEKMKDITLFYIEDGVQKQYAVTNISADGSYGFYLSVPQEAFYTLGSKNVQYPIYIKSGDKITIDIDDSGASLRDKNSKENIELYKWENYSKEVRGKSIFFSGKISTYEDFFPVFEKLVAGYQDIYDKVNSGNKKFDELLKAKIKYDLDYYAINFLYTPRTKHATQDLYPAFYKTIISKDKFDTDIVLSLPDGQRILSVFSMYISLNNNIHGVSEEILGHFKNDRIKGEYVVINCRAKDFVGYEAYIEEFGKYIITPSQKMRIEDICAKLANTKPGEKASNFTYPDKDGKMVSLTDFIGKVVLVDVWATWCGPCKGEIPYLIALEKELHENKNIVFMGVSVDEEKNKDAWKQMIEKEGLGGVQLFASGWSKIAKDYKITGIPRFMVFDKKGAIFSVDAPRPSDPTLKRMLLKLAAE